MAALEKGNSAQPMYAQPLPMAPAVWCPPHPVPGLPVKPPMVPPAPGQVLVSYEIIEPTVGCCKCDDLTTGGLIALVVLVLVFWPLAFIPCMMAECHTKVQRPVYGFPPGGPAPPMMMVAAPAAMPAPVPEELTPKAAP